MRRVIRSESPCAEATEYSANRYLNPCQAALTSLPGLFDNTTPAKCYL